MNEVGIVVNLHQPPTQEESSFRRVVSDEYIPLIKILKTDKNLSLSLIIPLAVFELLDKYGYKSLIDDIKALADQDRIEIIGTTAYSSYPTISPVNFFEQQVILNEYGLGYYVGSKQGFEGEPAAMVRNVSAFYSPDFDLNNEVVNILEEYGYFHVLVAANDVKICKNDNSDMVFVPVNTEFSKKMFNIEQVDTQAINDFLDKELNKEQILLLDFQSGAESSEYVMELFLDSLKRREFLVSKICDYVKNRKTEIVEKIDLYSAVNNYNNSRYKEIEDVLSKKTCLESYQVISEDEVNPVWDEKYAMSLEDSRLHNSLSAFISASKFACRDKYITTDINQLKSFDNLALEAVKYISDESISDKVHKLLNS